MSTLLLIPVAYRTISKKSGTPGATSRRVDEALGETVAGSSRVKDKHLRARVRQCTRWVARDDGTCEVMRIGT